MNRETWWAHFTLPPTTLQACVLTLGPPLTTVQAGVFEGGLASISLPLQEI